MVSNAVTVGGMVELDFDIRHLGPMIPNVPAITPLHDHVSTRTPIRQAHSTFLAACYVIFILSIL